MRQKTITLYQYDELPTEEAKQKAREWYRGDDNGLDYEWWDFQYEDARRAGLEITEFDLGGRKHIKGHLIVSMKESINAILKDHGKACKTYTLAKRFQGAMRGVKDEDTLEELQEEYTEALCEEYFSLLDQEYEYLTSDENIIETIRSNEYEFTEDGERA
jgi:hypothetical protein